MMDQQAKFTPRGLKSEFVGEAQMDIEVVKKVLHGDVQLYSYQSREYYQQPKVSKNAPFYNPQD